jgi:DnaJ-class molecular chaperone
LIVWREVEQTVPSLMPDDILWIECGTPTDYYQELEISRWASATEIKRAFRSLATRYHPDLCRVASPAVAEARMKRLNSAYSVLGCAQRRQVYDESLRRN